MQTKSTVVPVNAMHIKIIWKRAVRKCEFSLVMITPISKAHRRIQTTIDDLGNSKMTYDEVHIDP
jgi:hypothetical protein